MKNLLEGFRADDILGKEVVQVCFGFYQIKLNFEPDISISIRCNFLLKNKANESDAVSPPYQRAANVLQILGDSISDITVNEDRFALTFSKGITIELIRDNNGYESFEIWIGEKGFIV